MITTFEFSAGAYRGSFLEFRLKGTELTVSYAESLPDYEHGVRTLSNDQIIFLSKELDIAGVRSWRIVDPPLVLDGFHWSLSVWWINGDRINLSGAEVYPDSQGGFRTSKTKEWRRFYKALRSLSPIQFE